MTDKTETFDAAREAADAAYGRRIAAVETSCRLLAFRLRAILNRGGGSDAITTEIRRLDPTAEPVLRGVADGREHRYPHVVNLHGERLWIDLDPDLGWCWRLFP